VQFPITIELRRSRLLVALLVLAHGLAAGCTVALPCPWSLRGGLLLAIGVSLGCALRLSPITGLRLCTPDRIDGLLRGGACVALDLQAESTVFSQLIVLRLRLGEARRVSSLVVLPDQMSAEQFRVLRLWLRWRTEPKLRAAPAS
jgi:toxin CptA